MTTTTWEDEVRSRVCWECGDPLGDGTGLVPADQPGWQSHIECHVEAHLPDVPTSRHDRQEVSR